MKDRIQKIIAARGVTSRRKAEEMITAGRVTCNGRVCLLGESADPDIDIILLDGKPLPSGGGYTYIMLHKPRGFVTTMNDEKGRKCVTDLVKDAPVRLFPVGRLDMNSEGLLLMTNDGEFANKLTHPSYHVNKTYRVTVSGDANDEKLIRLKEGIVLDGEKTLPCDCFVAERKADRTVLIFIIQEGRNRQIRRMCEEVGLEVLRLKRTEIAGVKLGMLKRGSWRPLNEREMRRLTSIT